MPVNRPGIKDVAKLAGVSVGTVSNVINDVPTVTPEMIERVNAAIAQIGYVRNAAAKTLRSGIASAVGVLVLDLNNPFFMEAAEGVTDRLSRTGSFMLLASTQASGEKEAELLTLLESHAVRGVLLSPSSASLAAAEEIVRRGTPVVLFDSIATPATMSSVSVDDASGAALAVQHLLGLGHRRIAFLNGPHEVRQSQQRKQGVDAAVAKWAGRETRLLTHNLDAFTIRAGSAGMTMLLADESRRPTAVFCANDLIAIGASMTAREHGLRIPDDLSIVGFDDIALASQLSVPLTTVRQPMFQLGWRAADLLLADASVRHETFLPELRVRKSTAPPR